MENYSRDSINTLTNPEAQTLANCSLLCEKGYYTAKWGFNYQTMRIRRHINSLVKHNYGWETEKDWLSRKPAKIESPTLFDRINNIL